MLNISFPNTRNYSLLAEITSLSCNEFIIQCNNINKTTNILDLLYMNEHEEHYFQDTTACLWMRGKINYTISVRISENNYRNMIIQGRVKEYSQLFWWELTEKVLWMTYFQICLWERNILVENKKMHTKHRLIFL